MGTVYTLTTTPFVNGSVLIEKKFIWSLIAFSVLVMVLAVGLLVWYCRKKSKKRFAFRFFNVSLVFLFTLPQIDKFLFPFPVLQSIPFPMTTKPMMK